MKMQDLSAAWPLVLSLTRAATRPGVLRLSRPYPPSCRSRRRETWLIGFLQQVERGRGAGWDGRTMRTCYTTAGRKCAEKIENPSGGVIALGHGRGRGLDARSRLMSGRC